MTYNGKFEIGRNSQTVHRRAKRSEILTPWGTRGTLLLPKLRVIQVFNFGPDTVADAATAYYGIFKMLLLLWFLSDEVQINSATSLGGPSQKLFERILKFLLVKF